MKTEDLKRSRSLIILLGVFLYMAIGCQGKIDSEKSETDLPEKSKTEKSEAVEVITPMGSSEENSIIISTLKNRIAEDLPDASGENKEKLNEILKYLNSIEGDPDYLEDLNNLVKLMETVAQATLISAEIKPDNFDINDLIAHHYLDIAAILSHLDTPDAQKRRVEYEKKALQAAKMLVEKFPNEAKAYKRYAFLVGSIEGDDEKALKLYKRCLELDPEMESCREFYDDLQEELKN